jgi:hypothetical protein
MPKSLDRDNHPYFGPGGLCDPSFGGGIPYGSNLGSFTASGGQVVINPNNPNEMNIITPESSIFITQSSVSVATPNGSGYSGPNEAAYMTDNAMYIITPDSTTIWERQEGGNIITFEKGNVTLIGPDGRPLLGAGIVGGAYAGGFF